MKSFYKFLFHSFRLIWLWFNPLPIGVRVLLIKDHQIYLVKHVYEDHWYAPGGTVEKNETLEQAVRREAMEEAGATLKDLELFGVYSHTQDRYFSHIVVFLSQEFELTGESDHEIEISGFYSLNQLPENISPGVLNRIKEYQTGKAPGFGVW